MLVFGAGTDYALLLIARYREELRRTPDRRAAMRAAWLGAAPAIAASAATVILALLTLLLARTGGTQALGLGGAIGIATALLFGLVVLPAALVVCPRGIFWPLVPKVDADDPDRKQPGRGWRRIGLATARRPIWVTIGSVLLLAGLGPGHDHDQLRPQPGRDVPHRGRVGGRPEDDLGLVPGRPGLPGGHHDHPGGGRCGRRNGEERRGGDGGPARRADRGAGRAERGDQCRTGHGGELPDHPDLRAAVVADDPDAVVGGAVAANLDARDTSVRDLQVISPMILAVVLLVLIVLLRALVAPLVLILTVILSFFAALGAGSLLFTYVFDFPALDYQVPLLSFLFLVALGVDYNIFLVSRAREETATWAPAPGSSRPSP